MTGFDADEPTRPGKRTSGEYTPIPLVSEWDRLRDEELDRAQEWWFSGQDVTD